MDERAYEDGQRRHDGPVREVVHAEAFAWMDAHPASPRTSVITSLPDVSELPTLSFDAWRAWFVEAAERVIRFVPPDGMAIFFQSDIRFRGTWIDKGYLVMRAAESVSASLVWHKIVCRKPAGTITHGRASYSHMICVTRGEVPPPRAPGPDVLADGGEQSWSKAMGLEACRLACRYLKDATDTRRVVDPFCGHGTTLVAANELGFDAVGVDLSAKKCRAARRAGRDATRTPASPSRVRLRDTTLADVSRLRRWERMPHVLAAGVDDDWGWEHELARKPSWREQLIAEDDTGRAIGFVQIIDPREEDSHYWGECPAGLRAIDIWIGEPDDLGRGYGTEMMQLAIDRCFAPPDVTAIWIDPLASNLRARRFYERLGFRYVEERGFGDDLCAVYALDRDAWRQRKSP